METPRKGGPTRLRRSMRLGKGRTNREPPAAGKPGNRFPKCAFQHGCCGLEGAGVIEKTIWYAIARKPHGKAALSHSKLARVGSVAQELMERSLSSCLAVAGGGDRRASQGDALLSGWSALCGAGYQTGVFSRAVVLVSPALLLVLLV